MPSEVVASGDSPTTVPTVAQSTTASSTVVSVEVPGPAAATVEVTTVEMDITEGDRDSISPPQEPLYPTVGDGLPSAPAEVQAPAGDAVRDDASEVKIEISELPLVHNDSGTISMKEGTRRKVETHAYQLLKAMDDERQEDMATLKHQLYLAEDARFGAEGEW